MNESLMLAAIGAVLVILWAGRGAVVAALRFVRVWCRVRQVRVLLARAERLRIRAAVIASRTLANEGYTIRAEGTSIGGSSIEGRTRS